MQRKMDEYAEHNQDISRLSETEWKRRLSSEQFYILRLKGTERPFTGHLLDNASEGTYHCAGCGALLFDSSMSALPILYPHKRIRVGLFTHQ